MSTSASSVRPLQVATRSGRAIIARGGQLLKRALLSQQASMTVVAAALFAYFAISAPHFLYQSTLLEIGRDMSFVFIAAVGMTFLFIVGEFDLSVGSVLSFAQVFFAWLILRHGLSPWVSAVIVLAIGALIGVVNGGVSTLFRVPSLVTTLGMLSLLSGVALVMTGEFPFDLSSTPNSGLFSLVSGTIGSSSTGIPAEIPWMLGIGVVGTFVLRRTKFGYNVFSSGGNPKAARAMGIRTGRVKVLCFVILGALTAFVGIMEAAWFRQGSPVGGDLFLFQVMGAVILGGISISGGDGSIYGTFVGAFLLAELNDGLVLRGVSGDYTTVFTGGIIVFAGILNEFVRRSGGIRASMRRLRQRIPLLAPTASETIPEEPIPAAMTTELTDDRERSVHHPAH